MKPRNQVRNRKRTNIAAHISNYLSFFVVVLRHQCDTFHRFWSWHGAKSSRCTSDDRPHPLCLISFRVQRPVANTNLCAQIRLGGVSQEEDFRWCKIFTNDLGARALRFGCLCLGRSGRCCGWRRRLRLFLSWHLGRRLGLPAIDSSIIELEKKDQKESEFRDEIIPHYHPGC